MIELHNWKSISDASPSEVVLAIDFAATGRAEASFSDLMPKLQGGLTVWETLMPESSADSALTGEEYIRRWLQEVRESGRTVRAVLGYCVGGIFACVAHEQIAEWQPQPPQLIVFDPEPPAIPSLYRDYVKSVTAFAQCLSADELAGAQQAGAKAVAEGGDDFDAVGATLEKLFRETVDVGLERLGLDPELREELSGIFGSFVRYLVAARQLDPLPGLAHATVISSSQQAFGVKVAREVRFDMNHEDVLRDDRVARAVRDVFAEYPGTGQ